MNSWFEKEKENITIDQKRKEDALRIIRQAVEEKEIQYQPSLLKTIIKKGKQNISCLFILQIVSMIGIFLLLLWSGYLKRSSFHYLICCSSLSSFLGVFLSVELNKSISYHKLGLEQNWYIKLLTFGIVDLLFFIGIIISFFSIFREPVVPFSIYILASFLLSHLLYLFIVIKQKEKPKSRILYAAAFVISTIFLCLFAVPNIYKQRYLWVWILVCVIAVILVLLQIITIIREIEQGTEKLLVDGFEKV